MNTLQPEKNPADLYTLTREELAGIADLHTAVGAIYDLHGLGEMLGHLTYLYRVFLEHAPADSAAGYYRDELTMVVMNLLENLSRVYETLERVDTLALYKHRNP